jgi:2-polyprenyl-6-methoxyphenol hydroxylase-like FAD-dependent oxidoreductase
MSDTSSPAAAAAADIVPTDIVIVGGGIAGGALANVLARAGRSVTVLERDLDPVDRVRGEFMALWGVIELGKLGLLDLLRAAGANFTTHNVPYDENRPGAEALAFATRFASYMPDLPGALCMSHPAACRVLLADAETLGARVLRGVRDVEVRAGARPEIGFQYEGVRHALKPRLIVGADGRNSIVRQRLGFPVLADPPHNLLGGMLVEGVPDWPQDMQVIGTEDRAHFLVFPQGGDKLRLYLCYGFDDKARFAGPERQRRLIETFTGLKCLPQAAMIAAARVIGPFNSYSNEDHWVDVPVAPGVVLVGDAAGHNDPINGQGLSIALRDVRLVSEIILGAGGSNALGQEAFQPYVDERRERMRRLRIAARFAATLRVEFGEEARLRRGRAQLRMRERMPSPLPATMMGPDRLPAACFEPAAVEALLAP